MREGVRFEESGYETPADTGLDDELVVNFVQLKDDEPEGEMNIETEAEETAGQ